jgi:hypothetical protein
MYKIAEGILMQYLYKNFIGVLHLAASVIGILQQLPRNANKRLDFAKLLFDSLQSKWL